MALSFRRASTIIPSINIYLSAFFNSQRSTLNKQILDVQTDRVLLTSDLPPLLPIIIITLCNEEDEEDEADEEDEEDEKDEEDEESEESEEGKKLVCDEIPCS